MSIRWHLRSSRPSSKTANSPTGPAPMTRMSVLVMLLIVSSWPDGLVRFSFGFAPSRREILFRDRHAMREIRRYGLSLPLGNTDDEAVQFVAHLDLAGKARIRANVESEVEHVLFHRLRLADDAGPPLVDVDMAGSAGAGPAAFGLDARNAVADGVFHHRRTVLGVDLKRRAVECDVGDLGHRVIRGMIPAAAAPEKTFKKSGSAPR